MSDTISLLFTSYYNRLRIDKLWINVSIFLSYFINFVLRESVHWAHWPNNYCYNSHARGLL